MYDAHRKELHGHPAATGWSDVPDTFLAPDDPTAWPPFTPAPEAKPGSRATRLAGLRREHMSEVLQRIAATCRPVRVAVYALADRGQDPGPDLAAVRQWVDERDGWAIASWHFDDTGPRVPLADRPGWQQARATVSGGFASGLVTVNRNALVLPSDHDGYEQLLDWFVRHAAFLAHIPAPLGR